MKYDFDAPCPGRPGLGWMVRHIQKERRLVKLWLAAKNALPINRVTEVSRNGIPFLDVQNWKPNNFHAMLICSHYVKASDLFQRAKIGPFFC